MKVVNSVTELIGQTPLVKLNRLVSDKHADVYLKLEFMNPGSSVKDRIGLASKKEKNIVAWHEAGHTVVGVKLENADMVHKVTIVPRGMAGGYAVMLPKEDRYFMTQPELLDKIVGLLGDNISVEAVHINHQLRADEADADEAFVREECQEYGIPLTVQKVDVTSYANMNGMATQLAARELRYKCFTALCENERTAIVTAHHGDVTDGHSNEGEDPVAVAALSPPPLPYSKHYLHRG